MIDKENNLHFQKPVNQQPNLSTNSSLSLQRPSRDKQILQEYQKIHSPALHDQSVSYSISPSQLQSLYDQHSLMKQQIDLLKIELHKCENKWNKVVNNILKENVQLKASEEYYKKKYKLLKRQLRENNNSEIDKQANKQIILQNQNIRHQKKQIILQNQNIRHQKVRLCHNQQANVQQKIVMLCKQVHQNIHRGSLLSDNSQNNKKINKKTKQLGTQKKHKIKKYKDHSQSQAEKEINFHKLLDQLENISQQNSPKFRQNSQQKAQNSTSPSQSWKFQ